MIATTTSDAAMSERTTGSWLNTAGSHGTQSSTSEPEHGAHRRAEPDEPRGHRAGAERVAGAEVAPEQRHARDGQRVGGEREEHPDLEAHVVGREVDVAEPRGDRRREQEHRAQHDGPREERAARPRRREHADARRAHRDAVLPRDAHQDGDVRRRLDELGHRGRGGRAADPEVQHEHEERGEHEVDRHRERA